MEMAPAKVFVTLFSLLAVPLASAVQQAGEHNRVCMLARRDTADAPSFGDVHSVGSNHGDQWFTARVSNRTFWQAGDRWNNPFDCWQGCGVCLEQAALAQADAVACNQRTDYAFCTAGYSPHDWWDLTALETDHCDGQNCEQGETDLRQDLRKDLHGYWDAPRDQIGEIPGTRGGDGSAQDRMGGGGCGLPTNLDYCNQGHRGDDPLFGIVPDPISQPYGKRSVNATDASNSTASVESRLAGKVGRRFSA